jgi:hypothetical protein
LTPFPTRDLLPLTRVSHRFHALILRILHYRLLIAASPKEYKLMLECYHPSDRLTEPHVFCTYLGTDGLSNKHEGQGSLYENCTAAEQLRRLMALYSRFRPEHSTEDRFPEPLNWRPPTGAVMSPEGTPAADADADGDLAEEGEDLPEGDIQFVKRLVNLDGFEDFYQLCTDVSLAKVMPGTTRVLSMVGVENGLIRIWRDWLKGQAKSRFGTTVQSRTAFEQRGSGADRGGFVDSTAMSMSNEQDNGILWVDEKKNVGLKLRVKEKRWNRNIPVLVHRDEQGTVSYEVEIEGRFSFSR